MKQPDTDVCMCAVCIHAVLALSAAVLMRMLAQSVVSVRAPGNGSVVPDQLRPVGLRGDSVLYQSVNERHTQRHTQEVMPCS